MTQKDRISKYMDDFTTITPMQAFFDLGITKLSTRIGEMIRDGEKIKKTKVNSINRYGEKVHFMMYEKAV